MTADPPELFPVALGQTLAEDAMKAQIEAWQAQGRAVDLVQRRTLLDQAHAVDLARAARRPTAITGAHRVMLELLLGFRLVDNSPPPADSEFDRFLATVRGDGQ